MMNHNHILARCVVLATLLELVAGYAVTTPSLLRRQAAQIMLKPKVPRGPKMQQNDLAAPNGVIPLSELIPTLPAMSYPTRRP